MSGLIYKEFVQNRKFLLILMGCILFMSLMIFADDSNADAETKSMLLTFVESIAHISAFIFLNIVQPEFIKADESKKWVYFAVSAPKGAADIVRAKYIFILAVNVLTNILCYMTDGICSAVTGVAVDGTLAMIAAFYVNIFLSSIDMLFIMRFGSKAGQIYRSALLFVVLFAGAVYGLFGDLSIFGSPDTIAEKFVNFISSENIPSGLILFMGVFPFVSAAMYYASYRLSCKLYVKGADNFEG